MANAFANGVKVSRTGASEWTVYKNGLSEGAFSTKRAAISRALGLAHSASAPQTERFGNLKTAVSEIQVITMTSFTGTDSFTITQNGATTIPFVRGTNAAESDLQAALRTLTGDSTLTVTGTLDEGPYTVTYVSEVYAQPLFIITGTGCTGAVTISRTGGTGV